MTIDTNTVLMSLMALITVYFAYGFFKSRMDEKFTNMTMRLEKTEDEMWHSQERLSTRINNIEQRCCAPQKCERNYYNSEA